MMSGFETRFDATADLDRIRATFYGFLHDHAADADGDAHILTEVDGHERRLLVRLWSPQALAAFLQRLAPPGRSRHA